MTCKNCTCVEKKDVSEISLSIGTKKAFGNWTLFVKTGGETTAIKISNAKARDLMKNGVPTQG